jgi:hypothetical protein
MFFPIRKTNAAPIQLRKKYIPSASSRGRGAIRIGGTKTREKQKKKKRKEKKATSWSTIPQDDTRLRALWTDILGPVISNGRKESGEVGEKKINNVKLTFSSRRSPFHLVRLRHDLERKVPPPKSK